MKRVSCASSQSNCHLLCQMFSKHFNSYLLSILFHRIQKENVWVISFISMESKSCLTSENQVHYGLTGVSYPSQESDYSGQQLSLPTVHCTVSFGCQGVWQFNLIIIFSSIFSKTKFLPHSWLHCEFQGVWLETLQSDSSLAFLSVQMLTTTFAKEVQTIFEEV